MSSHRDYFSRLPAATQMKLRKAAWEHMRIRAIPDRETALRLLELQHMHIDVLERHVDWLERGKACGEREGREWTTSALREFDALWADK